MNFRNFFLQRFANPSRLQRAKRNQKHAGKRVRELSLESLEGRQLLAAFTPGNVVVYRVGSGTTPLSVGGNAVFLDEYSPSGSLVQSIAMPSSMGSVKLIAGINFTEGMLTLSPDGSQLALTGYNSTPLTNGSNIQTTSTSIVNRSVAIVDSSGDASLYSFTGVFSNDTEPRSAVVDGDKLYLTSGTGGTHYVDLSVIAEGSTNNSTTGLYSLNFGSPRSLAIADGQLYNSFAFGNFSIGRIGTNLPTAGNQAVSTLPGLASGGSVSQFFFADLSPTAGINGASPTLGSDTLYVADEGAVALRKYTFNGTTWVSEGSIGLDADDYRGLTGSINGTTVTLFAVRKGNRLTSGGGELVKLVDASGYNGALAGTPTLIASAVTGATNGTAFRGVAMVPVALNQPPSDIGLTPSEIPENEPAGTTIGAFTTTDPDAGDTFTYTLAAGSGDTDNASFTIDNGVLKTAASFDFETKSSYAIRVRSSDAGGLFTEKAFTIQVTDVGESTPPVLGGITGAAAVTYKENAIPLLISSAATVTDPDSPNYGGGVLKIWLSNNATADDRLSIKHLGDTGGKIGVDYVTKTIRYGNVPIATYTGGDGANTFVITFNGSAGTAAVQATLRAITFENVSHSPSPLARTVSFQLADNGGGVSTVATRTVNVTPVIDKPVVTVTNRTVEYIEGAAPILIDGGVTVSDLDSPDFDLGKLIVKSVVGGQSYDRFVIAPSSEITTSGNTVSYNSTPIGTFAGTTSLTVTLNSNANAANVQELARRIAFWNISGTPSATPRQISFSVSDGDGGTSLAALGDTVNVTPVNIDPVLTLSNLTAATYTENALPVLISSSATVVDVDLLNFDGGALTVAITGNGEAADVLSVKHTPPASGKVSANYLTGAISYTNGSLQTYQVATFTGGQGNTPLVILFNTSALKTEVQAVMRAVSFASSSEKPSTAQRTVSFTLTDGDGGTSAPVIRSVNVVAKNDAPGVGSFGPDANYTLGGSPASITDSATVVDPDSPDFSAGKLTVALGANRSSLDRVEVSDGNGITVSGNVVSYNGNAIGTFAGTTTLVVTFNSAFATPDAVQALLRQLTFRTTALTARVVTVTAKVTDGDGGTSPIVSKLINVTNGA